MAQLKISENFESIADNALITDYNTYDFANFPLAGSGGAGNPSSKWEADSGGFYGDVDSSGRHWGWSGRPIDWVDKYFFRLNTRAEFNCADQIMEFDYKSSDFGVGGYAVEGGDAVDVWHRYQTQYWLYVVQFDRTNNGFVCKRKVPSNSNGQFGGPSNNISNKGVYYTLKTDSQQPIFGAGLLFVSWNGVASLLAADAGKPNHPNLAHDGSATGGTIYHFKTTITTYDGGGAFDYVRIQLFRAGALVGSWTDANDCISPSGSRTFQSDWNNGYFNNVTGFDADWGFPIYGSGKSGWRSDNQQCWFDNIQFTDAAESDPEEPAVRGTVGVGAMQGIGSITL